MRTRGMRTRRTRRRTRRRDEDKVMRRRISRKRVEKVAGKPVLYVLYCSTLLILCEPLQKLKNGK